MYKKLIIAALTLLLVIGCGRKEAPQVIAEASPPSLVSFAHVVSGNGLKINVRLAGGSGGVGYQVDRAEIDPYCKCPGMWRRYVEEYPSLKNRDKSLTKMINLRTHEVSFAFRGFLKRI